MGWECFCGVGFDLGPLLQGPTRILHLQYFFKYVLTYFLHLNSYLVTFLHNTICRAQLFCPFLLSASEFLSNTLFNYHLLYFCTALSLLIMLSSNYHLQKSKTLSQLTQCPFTGTLLLLIFVVVKFQTLHNKCCNCNVFLQIFSLKNNNKVILLKNLYAWIFSTVTLPLLPRFSWLHNNLKNILHRPFKFGTFVDMGKVSEAKVLWYRLKI